MYNICYLNFYLYCHVYHIIMYSTHYKLFLIATIDKIHCYFMTEIILLIYNCLLKINKIFYIFFVKNKCPED